MPSYVDISRWVHSIADPASPPTPPNTRKRSYALVEMDSNAHHALKTPKRSRTKTVSLPNIVDENSNANVPDPDPTPRAPTSSANAYPLLAYAPKFTSPQLNPADDGGSSTSVQSGNSKKRSRSGSPQKQISARQFALYPIQYATMSPLSALPDDVKNLVRRIKHVSQNIGILPAAARTVDVDRAVGDGDEEEDSHLFYHLFHVDVQRSTVPDLTDVEILVKEAAYNQNNGALEATWNCHVHYPLLQMAHQHSQYRHRLRWCNITPASIHPKSLVPDQRENEKLQSRRVDFGLSLQLDPDTQRRLALADIQLNQTDYGPIKHHALALSIETKLLGDGAPEARNQISTWAEAQIKQLRNLLLRARNPTHPIPPLPLLLVQGNDWTFWCFKDHDGRSGTFYDKGIMFGSTESALGTYKIIAGLHFFMAWAIEVWWPWIEEAILRPLIGDPILEIR